MSKLLLLLCGLMALMAGPALAQTSSLQVGEFCPAHHPNHITGPDKGTDTCPV